MARDPDQSPRLRTGRTRSTALTHDLDGNAARQGTVENTKYIKR